MRKITLINQDWTFIMPGKDPVQLNIPHTWNGTDGQDGGNDYLRTKCVYIKKFIKPAFKAGEAVLIEFRGVNSECEVFLNGKPVASHKGGYSTFLADITGGLTGGENELKVVVSNEKNNTVYPQRADFTFYGGIYRDVYLIVLPENRFDYGPDSSPPLKLETKVEGGKGILTATGYVKGSGEVTVSVSDGQKTVARGKLGSPIEIPEVRLWNGKIDPFLYTVTASLKDGETLLDEVSEKTGFRTFYADPEKGFFLNGKSYPLRGVCRHQDRPKIGNAISKADQDEDMDLILEIGANTVRLAHYQHDQYFYDLCDEKGLVVWAEIPYISEYLPDGDQNTVDQIRELVRQNYNHPSIVCWGISNEIMIKPYKGEMLKKLVENHKACNAVCKAEDPSRLTVVACYAMTGKNHPTAHVTDIVSWNLYYGWYVPNFLFFHLGMRMNGYRKKYPKTPLGLSEYGAEGMINLQAAKPKRLDNTEGYQVLYHEKTLDWINKNPWLWATHIWNMFDFGSDGRNQGGEPGMNHKGLITIDRKTKKDAFYLYKASWSNEKFIHICGKRYQNRTGKTLKIKVYSNCETVALTQNGKLIAAKKADRMGCVFEFTMPAEDVNKISATGGTLCDTAVFNRVQKPDPSYKLAKAKKGNNMSWEK